MIKKYNKLVRVNVPKLIEDNGEKPKYKTYKVNSTEARQFLLDKMKEEIEEVRLATTDSQLLEEMGDVYQVFRDLMKMFGTSLPTLEKTRQIKERKTGPFIKDGEVVFLESVEILDDKK